MDIPNTEIKKPSRWVRIVRVVYYIVAVISFLNAFGSVFIFDGTGDMNDRYGIFFASWAFFLSILFALGLSKKNAWALLLPVIPFAFLFYFSNTFGAYYTQSNLDFCMQGKQEGKLAEYKKENIDCALMFPGQFQD